MKRLASALRNLLCLSAAFTLGSCEERRLEEEAIKSLSEVMFDPTNILTRKLRRSSDGQGGEAICGEVNGKNRLGGFVGFKPFVAVTNNEPIVAIDRGISTEDFDYSYTERVEQGAYSLLYQRYCASPEEKKAFAVEMKEKARQDTENAAHQAREGAKRAAEWRKRDELVDKLKARVEGKSDLPQCDSSEGQLVDENGNPLCS